MKGQTKAKLFVFFIIAIIGFSLGSLASTIITIDNPNSNKIPAIENDNFTPKHVNYVPTHIPEPNVINDTNRTGLFNETSTILNNTDLTDVINKTDVTDAINNTKNNISDLLNSDW